MHRFRPILLALFLAPPLVGCGGNNKEAEETADETIAEIKRMADVMESVKDADTAKAAAKRLNQICDKLVVLRDRERNNPISASQKEQLEARLAAQLIDVAPRLEKARAQAAARCENEASYLQATRRIQSVFDENGS